MPIVINFNICDNAPECGGIEVCPTGAFHFDEEKNTILVDESKCIQCMKCTLPNVCPVNCIYYARDQKGVHTLQKMFNADPRTYEWLWSDRYGCSAAKIPPKAKVLFSENIDRVLRINTCIIIDIWHSEFMDCRAFSPRIQDITKGVDAPIYKLNASRYPDVAEKLQVSIFPSLLCIKSGIEQYRFAGPMGEKDVKNVNAALTKLCN